MRVLLISGSLRDGSTNSATLRTLQEIAPAGVDARLYEGMAALPHFSPDDDREGEAVHPAVADLRGAIAEAEAIVICTPEYAGALPARSRTSSSGPSATAVSTASRSRG